MNVLTVPLHIDALVINDKETVTGPFAKISRLPYVKEGRDHNSDIANISEEMLNQPFQENAFTLKRGIHLHWTMPAGLRLAVSEQAGHLANGYYYPSLPNRWLVVRKKNGVSRKQWIIESDYLYPEGHGQDSGSICFPYSKNLFSQYSEQQKNYAREEIPFRYMGRKLAYEDWEQHGSGEYLGQHLTAAGYGEPTFAAYYPGCHSVFGCHDDCEPSADLSYEVYGWYSSKDHDVLTQLEKIESLRKETDLKKHLNWKWTGEKPSQSLYVGQLNIKIATASLPVPSSQVDTVVGHTPLQALCALLAHNAGGADKHLEQKLEAVDWGVNQQGSHDDEARFAEERHNRGFAAEHGSNQWIIDNLSADAKTSSVSLPPNVQDDLYKLNQLQQQYDANQWAITSDRQQLFADWYKYMLSKYPPPEVVNKYPDVDLLKYFIEAQFLSTDKVESLEHRIKQNGRLVIKRDEATGSFDGAKDGTGGSNTIATAIIKQAVHLQTTLRTHRSKHVDLKLRLNPGPRFWQPHEPVVLMSGKGLGGNKQAINGTLECFVLQTTKSLNQVFAGEERKNLMTRIRGKLRNQHGTPAVADWKRQSWQPLMLEWEVELYPVDHNSNLHQESRVYETDYIRQHYQVIENQPDLKLKQNAKPKISKAANIYSGRSLLSPGANMAKNLQDQIRLLGNDNVVDNQTIKAIQQNLRGLSLLCQSLSGFNDALLMHQQVLQLPITDPLGFEAYREFTHKVAAAIAGQGGYAPLPWNDFNPIRSGALHFRKLRLLDGFGRVKDVDLGMHSLVKTDYFKPPASANLSTSFKTNSVWLHPRNNQRAQIHFRWLSAEGRDKQRELQQYPGATMVCGWLLPDNLNKGLFFYDRKGKALGELDEKAEWTPSPMDAAAPKHVDKILDPDVKRLVKFIQSSVLNEDNFMSLWLKTLETSLDQIHPAATEQSRNLSLLIGRPLALVRASLQFELKGKPAVNQSWDAFHMDINRDAKTHKGLKVFQREHDNFTQVKLPVRIGEHNQLEDGVLGYFLEDGQQNYQEGCFHSVQSHQVKSAHIKHHKTDPLWLSLAEGPVNLTLLMDPHGCAHATSGVLPTKTISIPPAQYQQALENLQIYFRTTPLITPGNSITRGKRNTNEMQLSVPQEPGYEWNWLEKTGYGHSKRISKFKDFNADANFYSDLQIRGGWVQLKPEKQKK